MKIFPSLIVLIFVVLVLISCDDDPVSSSEDLVTVEVHLQSGFEGHLVLMEFNGDEYFRAELSESVPFSGPLATFSTSLPRGQNHLHASWGVQLGSQVWNEDSVDIQFDNAEKYYLGVRAYADTLNVLVQDNTFLYL